MKYFLLCLAILLLIGGGVLFYYQFWLRSSTGSGLETPPPTGQTTPQPKLGNVTKVVGGAEIWRDQVRNLVLVGQPVQQLDTVSTQIGAEISFVLDSGIEINLLQGSSVELTTPREYLMPIGTAFISGSDYQLNAAGFEIKVVQPSKVGILPQFDSLEVYVESGEVSIMLSGQPVTVVAGQYLQATKDASNLSSGAPEWFVR